MIRGLIAVAGLLAFVPTASAAAPVQGSVFGPVVSVNGTTFTITTSLSPTGTSEVSAASAKVTEERAAARSSVKVGACVMASGTRNSKGVVAATRLTVSQPVKGSCGLRVGTGANRPTPPAGGAPRGGGFPGNGGFAVGSVTKVKGSTLTVKGSFAGTSRTTTVTVSSRTAVLRTVTVKASAIKVRMCAFVQGTSADKGKTVKAASVALSAETKGKCTRTFRRPR